MKYRSPFERLSRAIKSESQLFYKRAPMYVCVYFSEQVSEYTGRLSCFSSKVIQLFMRKNVCTCVCVWNQPSRIQIGIKYVEIYKSVLRICVCVCLCIYKYKSQQI